MGAFTDQLALLWQIYHGVTRCKSIFGSVGIGAELVERRVRGWRGARRAKLAEAAAR
jgi:hypothetical protein